MTTLIQYEEGREGGGYIGESYSAWKIIHQLFDSGEQKKIPFVTTWLINYFTGVALVFTAATCLLDAKATRGKQLL